MAFIYTKASFTVLKMNKLESQRKREGKGSETPLLMKLAQLFLGPQTQPLNDFQAWGTRGRRTGLMALD